MAAMRRWAGLICALLSLSLFALSAAQLSEKSRPQFANELNIALPRFVQVLMSGGDRYLAANLADFRALVVSTETMKPEDYRILALIQSDASWLNPAHEDNYYLAAAILPWNGQVAAAQNILRAADAARPFDWQPAFYLAFDALHFLKSPIEGAQWLRVAASHTQDEEQQLQLQQMAANWISRGEDVQLAINLIKSMANTTKHKAFAAFLEKRVVRLENEDQINKAVKSFEGSFGRVPGSLGELVDRHVISRIPLDPFGVDYGIDKDGKVTVLPHSAGTRRTP
jgi:hypothetical protein